MPCKTIIGGSIPPRASKSSLILYSYAQLQKNRGWGRLLLTRSAKKGSPPALSLSQLFQ